MGKEDLSATERSEEHPSNRPSKANDANEARECARKRALDAHL